LFERQNLYLSFSSICRASSVGSPSRPKSEFTYDGKTYGTSTKAAFSSGNALGDSFKPRGELKVWREAMTILNDMHNPALDCIGASAFAGPLVAFTGEQSLLFSVVGPTGGGKTTAAKISQATWGHPVDAMDGVNDTEMSTINRISNAPNLPFIWDELKTQKNFDRFTETVFNLTQGRDKYRLTSDAKLRDPGRINTMMICCANDSVADQLTRATKSSAAGAIRCFEVDVIKTPSTLEPSAIARKVTELNTNFGLAGEIYAEHLGKEAKRLDVEVGKMVAAIRKTFNGDRDERFWHATIAVLLTGAIEANKLGLANFDIDAMWKFLAAAVTGVRSKRSSNLIDLTTPQGCEELISALFRSTMGYSLLITDKMLTGAGRPAPGSIAPMGDISRLREPWIHYAAATGELRIINDDFGEWLKERHISEREARHALQKFMGADVSSQNTFGAGVAMFAGASLRVRCTNLVLPQHLRVDPPSSSPTPGSAAPTAAPSSP
jgi:hypothetical protein